MSHVLSSIQAAQVDVIVHFLYFCKKATLAAPLLSKSTINVNLLGQWKDLGFMDVKLVCGRSCAKVR